MPSGIYSRIKKWKWGRKLSKTEREIVSKRNKKLWKCGKMKGMTGKVAWNKDKKGSVKPNKGSFTSEQQIGKKHWNWKGGITPLRIKIWQGEEYQGWRNEIFERDNYTCQKCKERNGDHRAHHIENFSDYPELRFELKNGITFCNKCHKRFHDKYGYRNNNKGQLDEFLAIKNREKELC